MESIILNNNITDINYSYFNKAILFKDEIWIYMFCYHYLAIKELTKNYNRDKYVLKNYISSITDDYIEIETNNKYVNQMDLVKLSGNNFALIKISEFNTYIIFITIFTLYYNYIYLKMRIYKIDLKMYSAKYEFFDLLKAFTFNNYIGIGYNIKNPPSTGFKIIGYYNCTDPLYIDNLFEINPNYELILSNNSNIDNSIFSNIL